MDTISDFYKRFGHEGGVADSYFCPAAVCIFKCEVYQVGLSLSFGVSGAYRSRSDGRIVLSRTDTNIKESTNISDIDRFHGSSGAEAIINAVKKMPISDKGAEILFHCDVSEPSLTPKLLCGTNIFARVGEISATPQLLTALTKSPAYQEAALTEGRVAVVNSSTLSYMTYTPDFSGKKIVVIKTGKDKKTKLSKSYYDRELARINTLSGSISALGSLMCEASLDILAQTSSSELDLLYDELRSFSDEIRILPDLSGAIFIAKDENIDEIIMLVGNRYKKKTGKIPAFYISD